LQSAERNKDEHQNVVTPAVGVIPIFSSETFNKSKSSFLCLFYNHRLTVGWL